MKLFIKCLHLNFLVLLNILKLTSLIVGINYSIEQNVTLYLNLNDMEVHMNGKRMVVMTL